MNDYSLYGRACTRARGVNTSIVLVIKQSSEIPEDDEFLLIENIPVSDDYIKSIRYSPKVTYAYIVVSALPDTIKIPFYKGRQDLTTILVTLSGIDPKQEFDEMYVVFEIYDSVSRKRNCENWIRKNKHNLPPVRVVEVFFEIYA